MAATARTSTPQTEPFPALDTATSTAAVASSNNAGSDASGLLRPPISPRPEAHLVGIPPKSDKPGFSPQLSPAVALTGVAAMTEAKRRNKQSHNNPQQQQQQTPASRSAGHSRQTTPNPAVEAMHSLLGGGGISKPGDAPAPDKLSEPLRKAAEKVHISDNGPPQIDAEQQASPVSLASFGASESTGTANQTSTAPASDASGPAQHFVAEPAPMTDGVNHATVNGALAPDEQDGNKTSFSYPGPLHLDQGSEGGPTRGMSLPGYGQASPKSPASNKRHKCPYCATDFTRHHNLKSHLLTHSQEKPYVCQTCQARFRRLHDLKRHTKLHTGERPHTCDKCGRRFARGDALARHNKGPGGCAGRRPSFGGEDEYGMDGSGGDNMDGVEYQDDEDDATDAHGRRISEPVRKRQQLETPHDSGRAVYRQHSSTYPPAPSRSIRGSLGASGSSSGGGGGGEMAPPTVVHPGSSAANSPHDFSGQAGSGYYGGGPVFQEPGSMTQSPKPLSPGHAPDQHRLSAPDTSAPGQLGRDRSTSLTTQFHNTRLARGRTPPQPSSQFPPSQTSGALLPPLGASAPAQQIRGGMHSSSTSGGPASNMVHHPSSMSHSVAPAGNPASNPGSLSSQRNSSGNSMRDLAGQDPSDLWNYVRSLDQRFSRMQDEYELRISRLQEEVISLKGQMSNAASYSSEMGSRY